MDLRASLRAISLALIPAGLLVYPLVSGVAFAVFLAISQRERTWPLAVPSLALALALALAALLSPWPLQAWQGVAGMLVIGATLILLVTRLHPTDRPWLAYGLALGLAGSGAMAVYEVLLRGESRAAAFSFHPNIAGALALVGTLVLLGAFADLRLHRQWPVLTVGLLGGLAVLALSGSRGAQFGFALGVVLFVLVRLAQGRGRKLAGLVAALAVAAIVVGIEPLLELLLRRAELGDDPLNPMGRTFMWLLALELAAYRPFLGYGFGAWRELVPIIEPTFPVHTLPHSHNLYLELLLDGGSLSLVAFGGWVVLLAVTLWQRIGQREALAASALAALAGTLIHNLFDLTLYQLSVAGLLWVALALGLAGNGEVNKVTTHLQTRHNRGASPTLSGGKDEDGTGTR